MFKTPHTDGSEYFAYYPIVLQILIGQVSPDMFRGLMY